MRMCPHRVIAPLFLHPCCFLQFICTALFQVMPGLQANWCTNAGEMRPVSSSQNMLVWDAGTALVWSGFACTRPWCCALASLFLPLDVAYSLSGSIL